MPQVYTYGFFIMPVVGQKKKEWWWWGCVGGGWGGTVLKKAPGHRVVTMVALSKMASGWRTQRINSQSRKPPHAGVWFTELPTEANKRKQPKYPVGGKSLRKPHGVTLIQSSALVRFWKRGD